LLDNFLRPYLDHEFEVREYGVPLFASFRCHVCLGNKPIRYSQATLRVDVSFSAQASNEISAFRSFSFQVKNGCINLGRQMFFEHLGGDAKVPLWMVVQNPTDGPERCNAALVFSFTASENGSSRRVRPEGSHLCCVCLGDGDPAVSAIPFGALHPG